MHGDVLKIIMQYNLNSKTDLNKEYDSCFSRVEYSNEIRFYYNNQLINWRVLKNKPQYRFIFSLLTTEAVGRLPCNYIHCAKKT